MSNPETGWTPNGTILMVIWILWTPFFLITFTLSVLRRNNYPLKQREPWLLATSAIGGYLMITSFVWDFFVGHQNYPCTISLWLIWIVYPCYFIPYPLRALRLIFIFKLNWERHDIGILTSNSSNKKGTLSFMMRYRKYFLNCGYTILLINFIFFIIGLVRQFTVSSNLPPNTGCQDSVEFFVNSLVLFMIFVIGLLIATFFIRNVKDQFNISNELKIVSTAWVLLLIPYLVVNLVEAIKENEISFPTEYLLVLWTTISYIASNFWPLYRSFFNPIKVEWVDCDVVNSLDALIQSEIGIKYFKEFLVSEFSLENLQFYLDIRSFKEISTVENAKIRALDIWEKYFGVDAPFELNLDSVIVNEIGIQIQKLDLKRNLQGTLRSKSILRETITFEYSDLISKLETSKDEQAEELDNIKKIFDQADSACYNLMKQSSYTRFLQSSLCKDLVTSVEKSRSQKKTIEELRLV